MVTTQPDGGPPVIRHAGTVPRPAATSTASTGTRSRRICSSTTNAASAAADPSPHHTPPGTGTSAPGISAPLRANQISHRAGTAASWAARAPAGSHTAATAAAPTESTTTGAATKAASTFTGTDTKLTPLPSPISSGVTATCVANGIVTASATGCGQPRCSSGRAQRNARNSSPTHAATDSANPACAAMSGSARTTTRTAVANPGIAARGLPAASASKVIPAITAARSTLGCGPATTTIAAIAIAPATTRPRGPALHASATARTAPTTRLKWYPETTTRCTSPVARKSAASSGSIIEVSPTASAGIRPASGCGTASTAVANRSRTCAASRCGSDSAPTVSGGPRALTIAAVNRPASASRSTADTVSRCPAFTSSHSSPLATSSTCQ